MLNQYAIIRALETISTYPQKSMSVRQLAKFAKISPAMASIAFDYFKNSDLTKIQQIGRTYQFHANLQNPLMQQWKLLFTLDQIQKSNFVNSVLKKIPNVSSILLYGSKARGTDDEKSDIDILIIAHNPQKHIDLSHIMSCETNILIYTPTQWKQKFRDNKVFYDNIIYDSIVLFGVRPVIL